MPKQLYEEALADVKKVKQVAEDNAKRTLLEAVTPRIREFIDQALLGRQMEDGDITLGDQAPEGELMSDITAADPNAAVPVASAGPAAAITPPDAEGKVTLDIDALCSSDAGVPVPPPMFGAPEEIDGEYEISLESIKALKPIASQNNKLHRNIRKLVEQVVVAKTTTRRIQATHAFHEQIARMISHVEICMSTCRSKSSSLQEKIHTKPCSRSATMTSNNFRSQSKCRRKPPRRVVSTRKMSR